MTKKITEEVLNSIKVLYRDGVSGSLWGIPYEMNDEVGQSPRNIWEGRTRPDPLHQPPTYINYALPDPGPQPDWVWLGRSGWYGGMSENEVRLVVNFIERFRAVKMLPEHPNEWVTKAALEVME